MSVFFSRAIIPHLAVSKWTLKCVIYLYLRFHRYRQVYSFAAMWAMYTFRCQWRRCCQEVHSKCCTMQNTIHAPSWRNKWFHIHQFDHGLGIIQTFACQFQWFLYALSFMCIFESFGSFFLATLLKKLNLTLTLLSCKFLFKRLQFFTQAGWNNCSWNGKKAQCKNGLWINILHMQYHTMKQTNIFPRTVLGETSP